MAKKNPRLLVAAFADPCASPRPRRVIELCLANGFIVDVLTLAPSAENGVDRIYSISENDALWIKKRKIAAIKNGILFHLKRSTQSRTAMIEQAYGLDRVENPFEISDYDAVIVQDLYLLPYCLRRRGSTPVIFDAREFYTKQREGAPLFHLFEVPLRTWTCHEFLPQCEHIYTVSQGFADAYKKEYGITAEVLRSTPSRLPSPTAQEADGGNIKMIHLGVANRNRRLEKMIDVFRKLDDRFTLDMYLAGDTGYIEQLKKHAEGVERLRILPPAKPKEIIPTMQAYQMGFYYLEPHGFNLKYCLPNKFFEFIQARLAVAIGPTHEMANLVREYNCGFVAPEFTIEAMAITLNSITATDLIRAREGSEAAAAELCAETEWSRLIPKIRELAELG